MLRLSKSQRGDTLIEVLFAVAVFSAVAIGSVVIMNQGIASAQNSLEISLVRNSIDSQAELLRHLNAAKLSSIGRNQTEDSVRWDKAVEDASDHAWSYDAIQSFSQCTPTNHDFPSKAFFIDPDTGEVVQGQDNFVQPQTFAQILPATVAGSPKSAMLWVQAVHNADPGVQHSSELKNTQFYDFHIRACWESSGANAPVMKLGTIVRLYVPNN